MVIKSLSLSFTLVKSPCILELYNVWAYNSSFKRNWTQLVDYFCCQDC